MYIYINSVLQKVEKLRSAMLSNHIETDVSESKEDRTVFKLCYDLAKKDQNRIKYVWYVPKNIPHDYVKNIFVETKPITVRIKYKQPKLARFLKP